MSRRPEIGELAEIDWKGIKWKAAHGDLSVPELLTILKGFGPMEVLRFEKPGCYHGELSLCITEEGNKEITLYYLEVTGRKRAGEGKAALRFLRKIFNGELFVEDPGTIRVENATEESLLFWLKMFREGLVDALECEHCVLHSGLSESDLDMIEVELRRLTGREKEPGGQ